MNHQVTRRSAVASLAAMLASCGGGANKDTGKKQFFVAFSQCNNAEPYRAAQNELLTRICSRSGDIRLSISDGQQDTSKQIAQIETLILQKPDLLIVAPNERAPLTAVMGKAMAAGIPTICLERDIVEPNYSAYVACDNYAIGKMAGQFIVDQLKARYGKPRGKIVELKGLLGVEAQINRHGGAHEVFEQYPDIKVVHEAVADWLQSKGRERMLEILRAQPEIDVVYGHNDPMAVGAYLAAQELGREKQIIFVGVDGLGGPAGGIKKVMDGVLAATFYYPLAVDKAMEIGNRMLREPGFKPDKKYVLSSEIITKANAAEMYQKLTF
ncbi:MAG: substrate-binding domain-containing protein [Acidobacteriia bacterium]|nr:substrate-binding domain-containing protein [Terriglobia bacterium]